MSAPTFCRHNRFIQNCPICSRGLQPPVAPAPRSKRAAPGRARAPASGARRAGGRSSRAGQILVRRADRAVDDGYRCPLVPGIKASPDARRLAGELAFSAARLVALAVEPPGLYGEVGSQPDREESTWLGFLIAYLGPTDEEDPFAGVRTARVSWASGETPRLTGDVALGPRTAHDPARGSATSDAYRAWAARAGTQVAALAGEAAWTPERRFARAHERLALPGLHRDARYDLLVTLGRLGVHELRAGSLGLGGSDATTLAAKRVFGIGDTLLLERRAADFAAACELPIDALDAGLWNWAREGGRATLGAGEAQPDPTTLLGIERALGLD